MLRATTNPGLKSNLNGFLFNPKLINVANKTIVIASKKTTKNSLIDCETAVGTHATLGDNEITLEAELFSLDGSNRFYEKKTKI